MIRLARSTAPEPGQGGAVLPLYLGLFLILLAFFAYLVAATGGGREQQAETAADAAADVVPPLPPLSASSTPPPIAELFRPLVLSPSFVVRTKADRLEAAVSPERIFATGATVLRPEFSPVLDRLARILTGAARVRDPVPGAEPGAAEGPSEPLDLQLLVGLARTPPTEGDPAGVADIIAERLAVGRAAVLARALLARGTPPETFAVGVAPAAGDAVRFLFRSDHHGAVSLPR